MKKLIAHRGNIYGKNPVYENHPDYIEEAIGAGYDVEADVWFANWSITGGRRKDYKDYYWFTGHDFPTYKIKIDGLVQFNKIGAVWCHAKNIDTMYELNALDIHCFYHDKDRAVFTNRGFIWTYPGNKLTSNSICVLPETGKTQDIQIAYGICSDYVKRYEKLL